VALAVKRVLVDWDWGAHGIWSISTAEERAAPAPPGRWGPPDPVAEAARPRPWSGKLSTGLLDALQEWNDQCGELFRRGGPDDAAWRTEADAALSHAVELAAWTQRELGLGYEVLFITSGGAWRWVQSPCNRGNADG
jgi:hypothetical protein